MELGLKLKLDLGLNLVTQVVLLALLLAGFGLQLRGPAASIPRNPFSDSHTISTLTDVAVNDLDRMEMSTYQSEDTSGWL